MFNNVIRSTLFSSGAANNALSNIYGDSWQGDVSFVSTLRALMAPRLKDDDEICLHMLHRSAYSRQTISGNPDKDCILALNNGFNLDNIDTIRIVEVNGYGEDDIAATFELIERSFTAIYDGWVRLEKVTDFYRKQFKVLCFVNSSKRSVIIYVDALNHAKLHYLQCSILAFLPWYFDPDDGVLDIEMSLIESLRERSSDKYEQILRQMASGYDFRSRSIKKYLSNFETQYNKAMLQSLRKDMDNYTVKIREYNDLIGDALRRKDEVATRLFGLEKKISQNENNSEIMDYFLCNTHLSLIHTNESRIKFGVSDYISYFDEDILRSVIDNPNSYMYRDGVISCDDMERLVRAIFIDQTLRIKVCAVYVIDLIGGVDCWYHYNFRGDSDFHNCMPNIHIDHYQCLGNYHMTINELMSDHNYIGAIEQCIASCKSLNFGDVTVAETFFDALYGIDDYYSAFNNCIELPNGTVVDPEGAVEWLNSEDEKKQKENEHKESEQEEQKNEQVN